MTRLQSYVGLLFGKSLFIFEVLIRAFLNTLFGLTYIPHIISYNTVHYCLIFTKFVSCQIVHHLCLWMKPCVYLQCNMISHHMIGWFVTASTVCFVFRNVERETLVNKTEEWHVEPRNVYETRLDLFLISSCKSKYARETSREAILFCLNYHLSLLHRCNSPVRSLC